MSTEEENTRPNIRIQIKNTTTQDSVERMEVDVEDNEEGEITDDNEKQQNIDEEPMKQVTGVFTTGIDMFDKREQEKLQERARRFALKPEEINNFSDQDMQDLYESLGINETNKNEIKFKVVHLVGLDRMSPEDVVDYFANYAPDGIEWIDKNSCNIVWLDSLSAARGLHFKSKVVRDMPAREPKDIFPKEFLDDIEPEQETGQSILIKNKNREVELQNEIGEVILPKKKAFPKNAVDMSEITIPVPPGYWRLGNPHPHSKCLLMRHGLISDKLPFKSEKCSKYFKKLANPGQKNVISETKKKELRSLFERNRDLNQKKNPWGALAKNWDRDAKFREREPVMYEISDDEDFPAVELKNPKLLARLGTKRKRNSESEEQKPEDKQEENFDIGKGTLEKKKTKIPRMKMYADEEEENMKRRKILQMIKKQTEKIEKKASERDLRDMLGPTSRLVNKKDNSEPEQNMDLGIKLKNRNQKMIFAIERDLFDRGDHHDQKPLVSTSSDARAHLEEKNRLRYYERERASSRSVLLREKDKRTLPEMGRKSEERYSRSSRRRTPDRTLRSDQMDYKRSNNLRKRSYSQDSKYDHKTRSKVAVVVKTPQKPTVASTIWSKVKKSSESEYSSSESNSDESENSSSSESESESDDSDDDYSDSTDSSLKRSRNPDRPGFDRSRLAPKIDHHSPLKITMTNEHYNKLGK